MASDSYDNIPISQYTDEELIGLIRSGSDRAFNELISRYTDTVQALSHSYFSGSLTKDDWFQEGMIGFLFAVHSYKPGNNASFASYASVCVKNQLNSSWRKANNSKNAPLNDYLAYNEGYVPSVSSPEEDYIENERYRYFTENYINNLSVAEQKVISCYLAGFSYSEIAKKLNLTEKSVDNALCRAKAKLKKAFKNETAPP